MKRRNVSVLLALLLLSACVTTTPAPVAVPYDNSIFQAAVFQPRNLRPLKPVVPDANGEAIVATLKGPGNWALGPLTLGKRGIWVTVAPEVKDRCRGYSGDLAMFLRQTLGLQPTDPVDQFITFRVRVEDLFRPTPDPRTDTVYPCLDPVKKTNCNVFPMGDDPALLAHKQWMAETFLTLQIPDGYPWTHLGYTYNWAPGADPYGASEYLIRACSNVVVTEVTKIGEYCK
jgi:hypothetical protein